ncbi:carboxylesterase [Xylariaceae sp. FL0016]|nr:carboxylesterase [Xylariaceae sp. FL0016]
MGSAFLQRAQKRLPWLRPWHAYLAVTGVVVIIVAVVVSVVVVEEREKARDRREREDQDTPSDPNNARVNLGYAQYQGSLVGSDGGVSQFLGMRYAKAPLDDLRWRAPVEPEQHSGFQKADAFGPICLGISQPWPNQAQDEDCLYVNVWAPSNATVDSKLPVWLFIQGGGYTANSNANWNGTEVVQQSGGNIVMVNFNYRVGLWGFLASERLRSDGDLNVGLLDQRFVMQWVKSHIAQFGGDPDHVVIDGASAGAGSVALHLIANGGNATDLFVGAIGESVFFPAQPFVDDLEWQFESLLNVSGCDANDVTKPVDCLRALSTTDLQALNVPSPFPGRTGNPLPLFYWTPCIDGELIQDLPYLMYESGRIVDVPVIMGTTTNEGSIFAANTATSAKMATFFQNNYPLLTNSNTEDIIEKYPKMTALPAHSAWFPSTSMAYGEATFICPAVLILSSYFQNRNSSRAWGYRYNVQDASNTADGLGVPHLFNSWAVFGPDMINGPGTAPSSYYTYNAGVVPLVMDYWISFVRTLDPSTMKNAEAPRWESWGSGRSRLMMESGNFTMENVPSDQRERCEFWQDLAPTMQQKI